MRRWSSSGCCDEERAELAGLGRRRAADRRLAECAAADTLGRVSARLVELCDTHGEVDASGGCG
jgi:hypothetical protein